MLAIAIVAVAGTVWAQAPLVGNEFQVNTYTTGYQYEPSIAGSSAGNFVVVWQSYPQLGDGAAGDIFGQRFDTNGSAVGSEFQVNSYTTGYQYFPDVALGQDGAFVVVWTNGNGDGDGSGIDGQRFDSTGQPVGSEFQVNSETGGYQNNARAAVDTNGNMTVVWSTGASAAVPDPDGSDSGIFARRFDATGSPVGTDFQVNEQTTGVQAFPDVEYDPTGNLVVVWQSDAGTDTDIAVRRFSGEGVALGSEVVITNPLTDSYPRVSVAGNGNFVVVWDNSGVVDGLDGSSLGVFAERFNADGTTAGPVFQVNTYTTEGQANPSVASGGDGTFVVAWDSYAQLSPTSDIIGQRYATTGEPFESEFKLDTFDDQGQIKPEIAWIGDDRFAVVWQSFGQDGDSQGIFGQLMAGGFPQVSCGDADSNAKITASDALAALRTAVGSGACELCVCDVNASSSVTASDALTILRVAVGQPVEFNCPACA